MASISPATARSVTRKAISGCSDASTTCSTSPVIALGRWRSRARWSIIPTWPKRPSSGKSHDLKGQAIAAFVTVKEGVTTSDALNDELKQHVARKIGAIARPDEIIFAADLPKTRSGKIMRRLLRDIAEGKTLGDTTTLADPAVVRKLNEQYEEKEQG